MKAGILISIFSLAGASCCAEAFNGSSRCPGEAMGFSILATTPATAGLVVLGLLSAGALGSSFTVTGGFA